MTKHKNVIAGKTKIFLNLVVFALITVVGFPMEPGFDRWMLFQAAIIIAGLTAHLGWITYEDHKRKKKRAKRRVLPPV